jgi:hypothetical protein
MNLRDLMVMSVGGTVTYVCDDCDELAVMEV